MGVPPNGWLGNIPFKWMMTGDTPILGNPQLSVYTVYTHHISRDDCNCRLAKARGQVEALDFSKIWVLSPLRHGNGSTLFHSKFP